MLCHIEIYNYKSIASCSLSLSNENVIVGTNGAGKSNLFDAMNFLRDAAVDGLDHAITKRHGVESIRRWSKTKPYHIHIKLSFKRGESFGYYRLVISSARGDFEVHEEEASWTGIDPFGGSKQEDRQILRRSFRRAPGKPVELDVPEKPIGRVREIRLPSTDLFLTQMSSVSTSVVSLYFSQLYDEIANCGAYSIYPNKIREPQSLSNADVLYDDGTNLASIIRQMRVTQFRINKERLTKAIQIVLPIVQEISIRSAAGFFVPTFRVKETPISTQHDLNMSQVSDGTLRMLGMLTAFYQPKAPNRITLEEPEQMIHPGLLAVLIDSGRDFLDISENKQLLYTTHSPTMLDFFSAEQIISCRFENGESIFSEMSARQVKLIKDHLFTPGELLVAEGILA